MALFGCTECGEQVSSEAATCPNCGASVPVMIKKLTANRRNWKPTKPPAEHAEKESIKAFFTKPFEQNKTAFKLGLLILAIAIGLPGIWKQVTHSKPPPIVQAPVPSPKTDDADRYGAVDTTGMPTYQPRHTSSGGVKAQFSAWDGSHIALTKLIKARLNDPSSYEHDKTAHVLKDGQMFIMARFRATNAFGALVLQNVTAQASAKGDGNDVTILSWE